MDKLGTYALVAALKEITRRTSPAQERGLGTDTRTQNERWISLRSMAQEMPQATLDPPAPQPIQEASASSAPAAGRTPTQPAPAAQLTTTPNHHSLESYRRIEMRHQAARRHTKD